jgi:hypothetical protein
MPAATPPPQNCGGFALRWRGSQALLLPRHSAAALTDVVAQAVALAPLLPLAEVLEAWLGEPLRLHLPVGVEPDGDALLTIGIGREGEPALCDLTLPIEQLGHSPLAPLATGWAMHWPRIVCDMLIEVWPEDMLDPVRLEPGALLLLPRSFGGTGPQWNVTLLARAHGLAQGPRPAMWHSGERTLSLTPHDDTQAPNGRAWAAIVPQAVAIDAAHWFGCGAAEPPSVGVVADAVQLRRGAQTVASGRLAPAGRGFGLLIERVDTGLAQGAAHLAAAA